MGMTYSTHGRRRLLGSVVTTLAVASVAYVAQAAGVATGSTGHTAFVVRIDSGWVRGTVESGLFTFRGVPYAAPPTGGVL